MTQQIHSTGRGGAGNIGPSDGTYTDGDIIREGNAANPTGSSGRGGAGNIGGPTSASPKIVPTTGNTTTSSSTGDYTSVDIIPESATRAANQPGYENFHTGRAGAGNVYKEKYGGHSTKGEMLSGEKGVKERDSKGGLVEKVKELIAGGGKREKTPEVGGK